VLVGASSWYGLAGDVQAAVQSNVVLFASQIWWGSGCRIAGPSAAQFYSAIGGAMALAWLLERGDATALGTLGKAFVDRAQCDMFGRNPTSADPSSHRAAFSLALFHELKDKGGAALQAIRELTHRNWGSVVPGRDVVETLRAAGVDVPLAAESW
jgi:hypothetical protein